MQKEYRVQVLTNVDDSEVKGLESLIDDLKMQQLQLRIKTNTSRLDEVNTEIENAKAKLADLKGKADVDDSDIKKVETELAQLESEKINLQIAVAKDELTQAKAEEEALNTTAHVDIEVNDTAVQGAMQNINEGINQTKQGLSEVADGFNNITEVGKVDEQNRAFLEMNLGAEEAAKQVKLINDTVASMPGDDSTMRSILSTAQAMGENLDPKQMEAVSRATANYLQGSMARGKMPLEAQSDILKYIIDGNTAELERGSIVSKQLPLLENRNSVMERTQAMTEALNKEGFMKGDTGIADMNTLANKTQSWEGALYNAQTTMAGLWMDSVKGIEDFGLKLDDATGGLSSIAFVAAQEFGPGLFSSAQGLISMGSGLSTVMKNAGGLSGLLGPLGGALSGLSLGPIALVIGALVALGVAIYEVGKAFGWWSDLGTMFEAITAGAQQMWNAFMSNEYVIQAIDMIKQGLTDAWNAIVGFGQAIMSALTGAGGQFDILSWAINGLQTVLNAVGPIVILLIQGMIQHFRNIYTVGQIIWPYLSAIIGASMNYTRTIISGAMSIWTGLQGAWRTLQSVASAVFGAINGIVSGAGSAWEGFKSTVMGAIQPIIDRINDLKNAASGIGDLLHSVGLGGLETPSVNASYGSGGTTTVSQGNTIIFNMYGDVRDEKTIDDMINAINERLQFESLANGVTSNNNGVI